MDYTFRLNSMGFLYILQYVYKIYLQYYKIQRTVWSLFRSISHFPFLSIPDLWNESRLEADPRLHYFHNNDLNSSYLKLSS